MEKKEAMFIEDGLRGNLHTDGGQEAGNQVLNAGRERGDGTPACAAGKNAEKGRLGRERPPSPSTCQKKKEARIHGRNNFTQDGVRSGARKSLHLSRGQNRGPEKKNPAVSGW